MRKSDYLDRARDCERMARLLPDPVSRNLLAQAAAHWRLLAETCVFVPLGERFRDENEPGRSNPRRSMARTLSPVGRVSNDPRSA